MQLKPLLSTGRGPSSCSVCYHGVQSLARGYALF
jgi:hypothetical protein